MLAWFRDLTAKERSTMFACFGGWSLDAFDVQMYSFVIPTVIAVWGISKGEAGLIGTVTLLISSLGGWFSGTLADRFGRVKMLQITILWYSFFTFLCAFAQNFEQLFILRALHGFGFGGEWAAGAVLMGEVIRDKYRGRGVGLVQTGWAVGWGASALVYTGVYWLVPEAMAWRVLFGIGLLPAVFVFYIRRHIEEPEIFQHGINVALTIDESWKKNVAGILLFLSGLLCLGVTTGDVFHPAPIDIAICLVILTGSFFVTKEKREFTYIGTGIILLFIILNQIFNRHWDIPAPTATRILLNFIFLYGGLPLILSIIASVLVFSAYDSNSTLDSRTSGKIDHLFSAFRDQYFWTTVKVALMVSGAQGGGYALGIWMPTYLRTVRGLSSTSTGGFLLVQILGALVGFLIGTWLSDAIGRKWTFLTSAIGSLVLVLVFMFAPLTNEGIFWLGIPLNIFLLMKFPPMGPFMTELYPTAVRGTGQGFCYNAGRAIGSFFPTMVGFVSEGMPLGAVIAIFSSIAFGVMIVMLMMLPETRGRSLAELDGDAAAAAPGN